MIVFFVLFSLLFFSGNTSGKPVRTTGHDGPKSPGIVGVTYRPSTPKIPSPVKVVEHLTVSNIPRVRLIDPDAVAISAFLNSGIDVSISLENTTTIESLASNASKAMEYLVSNVVPFLSSVKISSISVGYGVLTHDPSRSNLLLPSIAHLYKALRFLEIRNVSISTAHSYNIISTPIPPSSAKFVRSDPIRSLLDFTAAIGAAFEIGIFPFPYYKSLDPDRTVALSFAKFEGREDEFFVDPITRVKYRNLFDLLVDAVVVALAEAGHSAMPIVVVGTGWPNKGEEKANSVEYNERLAVMLNMKRGTPLRKKVTPVTYIHGLFDDNRTTAVVERSCGIWNVDLNPKYRIKFVPDHSNDELTVGGVTPLFCFCATMIFCLALVVRRGGM